MKTLKTSLLTSDASCQVSPQGLPMDLEETYAQFVELLPAALKNVKQAGKLAYTKFTEMIAYERFPMDDIARLLFLTIPSRPHTRNLKTVGHSSDGISGS